MGSRVGPQLLTLLATATLLAASGQPPVRREPFRAGAVKRWATVSDCGRYRYTLGRRWAEGSLLLWLLLNPSTADHRRDDATARVVEGFSRRLGFGGYQIGNPYAVIETDSRRLFTHEDPVGPENDFWIHELLRSRETASYVVCGWGDVGAGERTRSVLRTIVEAGREPRALALTKAGNPGHPLRKRAELVPQPWAWEARHG